MMNVILLERVEHLGQMGDVVRVKPGYARNYLLPQKKALRATAENQASFENRRTQLEAENLQRREEASTIANRLDGLSVVVIRQSGDTGQLYGSVTNRDVAEAITEAGLSIHRRQVQLDRPIKTLGLHPVRVVLHPEVSITVEANVARSPDEAEAQARGETFTDREDDRFEREAVFDEDDDLFDAPEQPEQEEERPAHDAGAEA